MQKRTLARDDIVCLKRNFGPDPLSVTGQIKSNPCTEYIESFSHAERGSEFIMINRN